MKVASLIGDPSIAGTWLDIKINPIEKIDANIPVITTWSAFFCPYISDIKSVIKNVKGYGNIPTDNSKSFTPIKLISNGYQ